MEIAILIAGFVVIAEQAVLVSLSAQLAWSYRSRAGSLGVWAMASAFCLMLVRRITAVSNIADQWESPVWLVIDGIVLPMMISSLLLGGFIAHTINARRLRKLYAEVSRHRSEGRLE